MKIELSGALLSRKMMNSTVLFVLLDEKNNIFIKMPRHAPAPNWVS